MGKSIAFIIVAGCCLSLNLYANKCSNINMFSHNDGDVIIHGDVNVSISCQNIVHEAEVKKEEISKILLSIKELDKNFNTYKNYDSVNTKKIYEKQLKELQEKLLHDKNQLSKIQKNITAYKQELNVKLFILETSNETYKNKIQNNKKIMQDLEKELGEYINTVDSQLSIINSKLQKHEKEIKKNSKSIVENKGDIQDNLQNITINKNDIENQSNTLSKHNSEIIRIGKIQKGFLDYFDNTSDKFYGLHVGTLYLDKKFGMIGGVDIEGFNRSSSSLFATLSGLSIDKEDDYSTLGRSTESMDNSKKYYSLEVGYKEFFDTNFFNSSDKIFLAVSAGGMTGDDSSFIASIFTGFEHHNKADNKIILELGTKYIDNISYREVSFNSLGKSSIVSDNREEFTGFLTLKYLWRSR